jgi:MFS family permease
VDAGKAGAIVDRVGRRRVAVRMVVAMMVIVAMVVLMIMVMMMIVRVIMVMRVSVMGVGMRMAVAVLAMMVMMIVAVRLELCAGLDGGRLIAAAANRTHQATSNSFTRISSPAVTCS